MKKSYILLGIIIIVFILLILNFKNSNSELATILNRKPEIPNNIYVKEEMVNNANTTTITNTYRKDKFIYQHIENDDSTANQDILWDFEAKKEIIIDNLSKTIDVIKISDENKAHQLLKDLINANIEVNKFEINKPTLNDIFIEKVGE